VTALGIVLAGTGALAGAWWIVGLAGVAAAVMVRVGAVSIDLVGALGSGWEDRIPADLRARMVTRWWRGRLPRSPGPRLRRDVPFATVPGTDRALLCDI
jgi:hypothetical protein